MALVILIGLISAIAAGLACAAEHGYAAEHNWDVIWRYGAGALTWLVALVPVFAGAVGVGLVQIEVAGLLYGMTVLVIGGMGFATVLAYRPPVAMPDEEEDELARKINKALRK